MVFAGDCMESSRQHRGTSSVPPCRAAGGGGASNTSSASGIFFQGDGQSPATMSSISGMGRSSYDPSSGDIMRGALNSAANSSGPSIGASSMVTDANSPLSGGPQLQRSASINNESYMRLPASPISFSSNNISGSLMMDGSSTAQQSSHQEHMQKQGASSMTSQLAVHEQAQKRPRFDFRHGDVLQQPLIQQFLQRHESLQLQGNQNPQLQAIIHQQRLAHRQQQLLQQQQQQQMLQSSYQPNHQQLKQQLLQQQQQHPMQPAPPARRSFDSGICARRLMQYMFHQRHRPPDNSILYWRKFVLEYFAPQAKKKWCLSMHENIGNHALGVFPQTSMDAWQCDICGSKSGKGFEASFEVLPRLCQIIFDRGVTDELLFLDIPHECRLANGVMVLEYAKVVQESVYEQARVVRDGQLRIIFTPELKILSWEFCARRHEEFISRKLIAPQVNQLLQVAQKHQSAVTEGGAAGVAQQDLQAICNTFVTAGRQLAKNLELQSLNDLGFSKRHVRCLQISEVVSSMKDLMDFSREHKIGPIESLKNYPRSAGPKLQSQMMQMEQIVTANSVTYDKNNLNIHPVISNHMNNNLAGTRALNSAQGAMSLNYQKLLRNSVSTRQNAFQPDTLSSFGGPDQSLALPFQGSAASNLTNSSLHGLPANNQQQPRTTVKSAYVNQPLFQHMMQDTMSNKRCMLQQSSSTSIANSIVETRDVYGGGSGGCLPVRANSVAVQNGIGMGNNSMTHMLNSTMSNSNSLKSVSNNPTISGSSHNSRSDLHQNVYMAKLDHDIAQEFAESGIFGDLACDLGYGWKV